MLKNIVEPDRPHDGNGVWCMHIAWLVTKATDTHSEYVICIAFPRQKWLHKCTSMLCYTYTACLVSYCNFFVGRCCATWQRPSYRDQAGKWSRWSTCEQNRECSEDHASANRWKLNLVLGDNEANFFSIWKLHRLQSVLAEVVMPLTCVRVGSS